MLTLAALAVVTLTVTPTVVAAPATIRATLRVEPHDANRYLCIYVDGPLRETSSCFPHTNRDLRHRVVEFVRLPAGDYDLWAAVQRADRTTHTSNHATVRVVGREAIRHVRH